MKRKIITNVVYLKQKSDPIFMDNVEKWLEEKKNFDEVIKDLEDSLDLKQGIGLSAIQIGILLQIGIIRIQNKEPINLYNPKIIEKEDPIKFNERCLSIPGLNILTKRYNSIVWENGDGQRYCAEGIEAIVVQHELDHMQGKTMLDRKWKKRR